MLHTYYTNILPIVLLTQMLKTSTVFSDSFRNHVKRNQSVRKSATQQHLHLCIY